MFSALVDPPDNVGLTSKFAGNNVFVIGKELDWGQNENKKYFFMRQMMHPSVCGGVWVCGCVCMHTYIYAVILIVVCYSCTIEMLPMSY